MKEKRYRVYSFRLDDRTYEIIREQKVKVGLSWNRFFYKLGNNDKEKNKSI